MTERAELWNFLRSMKCQGLPMYPSKRLWVWRTQEKNQAAMAAAYNPLPHLQQSPVISCDSLWAQGWKRPEATENPYQEGGWEQHRPPLVSEEEEGKMNGQYVSWEVQLNVFWGSFFPLKTPNRGSFGHLQSSFSRRRTFTLLLNSQREPLPDFIRGGLCLFSPNLPWHQSGHELAQENGGTKPHSPICATGFHSGWTRKDRKAFTSN